jgi:hypothetical protein
MNITPATISAALKRTIEEQERQLAKLVESEDWREAGDKAAYLAGLRFAATMVDMLATIRDETPAQTAAHYCEQCLTHDNLAWGPNPYAHEINDDDTPMWLCEGCRQELAEI